MRLIKAPVTHSRAPLPQHARMRAAQTRTSHHVDVGCAMGYMLRRYGTLSRFLHDGRICPTNNAVEQGLRGVAFGKKAWFSCGFDRGGERAEAMYSLIVTAKLNNVDPHA